MDIPTKRMKGYLPESELAEAFPGRIDHLNHDGTYTVAFDDGDSAVFC